VALALSVIHILHITTSPTHQRAASWEHALTQSCTVQHRLQNSLARAVLYQPRRTHAEPLLRSLHWLPVEHRVTYKLAVLTFNVRLTATPAYLNSLISNRVTVSRMSLRWSTRSLMAVPRINTVCASRSFSVCAPVVWNSHSRNIQLCILSENFLINTEDIFVSSNL